MPTVFSWRTQQIPEVKIIGEPRSLREQLHIDDKFVYMGVLFKSSLITNNTRFCTRLYYQFIVIHGMIEWRERLNVGASWWTNLMKPSMYMTSVIIMIPTPRDYNVLATHLVWLQFSNPFTTLNGMLLPIRWQPPSSFSSFESNQISVLKVGD